MEYISYGIAGVIVLIAIIFTIINYKYWKNVSKQKTKQYNDEIQNSLKELDILNNEIKQKQEFNQSLLNIREEELNNLIKEKKINKEKELEIEVAEWARSAQEAATLNSKLLIDKLNVEIKDINDYIDFIKAEVADYQAKQDAINQSILRQRELEEKQDFYRVQLDSSAIADIGILNGVRKELSKIDLLDKLIYDNYVNKSVNEMIKRVLNGSAPSGIYKITRLKTGEVYVGKSTDVKARWQQHAKSAFHCGTISHSMLHTTMEKDGIENFTWELIEEVPKEKLSDREKYWINFYDSKTYGLNEKEG